MSETPKSLSDLMNELSLALTDLSDKMSHLTVALENNLLDSHDQINHPLFPSARSIIEKAKNDSHQ